MTRLRNENSGVTVVVPEEKAARLGSEWVPVEESTPPRRGKRSEK